MQNNAHIHQSTEQSLLEYDEFFYFEKKNIQMSFCMYLLHFECRKWFLLNFPALFFHFNSYA